LIFYLLSFLSSVFLIGGRLVQQRVISELQSRLGGFERGFLGAEVFLGLVSGRTFPLLVRPNRLSSREGGPVVVDHVGDEAEGGVFLSLQSFLALGGEEGVAIPRGEHALENL